MAIEGVIQRGRREIRLNETPPPCIACVKRYVASWRGGPVYGPPETRCDCARVSPGLVARPAGEHCDKRASVPRGVCHSI